MIHTAHGQSVDGVTVGTDAAAVITAPPTPARLAAIVAATCRVLGVTLESLAGKKRMPRTVAARAVVALLAKEIPGVSYRDAGLAIGKECRVTMIDANKRMLGRLAAENGEGTLTEIVEKCRTLARQYEQGQPEHVAEIQAATDSALRPLKRLGPVPQVGEVWHAKYRRRGSKRVVDEVDEESGMVGYKSMNCKSLSRLRVTLAEWRRWSGRAVMVQPGREAMKAQKEARDGR